MVYVSSALTEEDEMGVVVWQESLTKQLLKTWELRDVLRHGYAPKSFMSFFKLC